MAVGSLPKHSAQISTALTTVRRAVPVRPPPVNGSPRKKLRRSDRSILSQSSGSSFSRYSAIMPSRTSLSSASVCSASAIRSISGGRYSVSPC